MRAMLATALLFVATASPASAQIAERWYVYGTGNFSCNKWTEDRKEPLSENFNHSWLVGALSGINAIRGWDVVGSSDIPSVVRWMDYYCATNPLDSVSIAVRRLIEELDRRRPGQ